MANAIDILATAYRRAYEAEDRFRGTWMMNCIAGARGAYDNARVEMELALADVERAKRLAVEIATL